MGCFVSQSWGLGNDSGFGGGGEWGRLGQGGNDRREGNMRQPMVKRANDSNRERMGLVPGRRERQKGR